ncbi:MAG: response regulator [bacterium]|nr:response regulator [bacterium]
MGKDSSFPSLNVKKAEGCRANGKPYRLMVVEDREFQRKQIVQIFESEGYEVVATASNGREALDRIDKVEGNVDLLTTNLDMPVLDGYAMMYELKEKSKKPLIVFISDETTKGVMQDLISMGIAGFILKPINRRLILEKVKQALIKGAQ